MQLAFYKGPADTLKNKVGHWLVCVLDTLRQGERVRHSHVELVIEGRCYTSSYRDGGVRMKPVGKEPGCIDLSSGHWDVRDVLPALNTDQAEVRALARFLEDKGKPYDWPGMLRCARFLRAILRRSNGRRFCSEQVARMLGEAEPEAFSPHDVLKRYAQRT